MPRCFWTQCFGFSATVKDSWAKNILDASNQNLTLAQKELLLWHQRLAHAGISLVHNLVRQRRDTKVNSEEDIVDLRNGHSLPCTYNVPRTSCTGLLCAACENAKVTRRSPSIKGTYTAPPSNILSTGDLKPGDCFSCDHYLLPVPGRIVAESGHSSSRHGYTCSAIYVDLLAL